MTIWNDGRQETVFVMVACAAGRRRPARAVRLHRGMPGLQDKGVLQVVIVTGVSGERIGTVERLEIDRSGRLKTLIVRIATAIDSRKRIDAARVRRIDGTVVEVDLTARDVPSLADEHDVVPELPWDEPVTETERNAG